VPLSPTQAFGQAVREARHQRCMTQDDAALNSGIDRAFFGHVERGTKAPTLRTVWRVARALDVRPSELIARAEAIIESNST
jgi:transcriptional regulator with XRE-family HTH domain